MTKHKKGTILIIKAVCFLKLIVIAITKKGKSALCRFCVNILEQFENKIFVPYRVCPLGAHTDHQKGIVTGFAIDKGITLDYSPSGDSSVQLKSKNFSGEVFFDVFDTFRKNGDWGDYAKAAAWALGGSGRKIEKGFKAIIGGEISAAGLSSSAAVLISYIKAFCAVNQFKLTENELILIAQKAENGFIGLNCGTLDQSCEVLCKKDSLLVLDTLDGKFENIKMPENMPDFEIGVFYSGISRTLVSSKYNQRTDELKASSYVLKAFLGGDYGKMNDAVLRDIPKEVFQKHCDKLPEPFRKRCVHFYSEFQRVQDGVKAFESGNLSEFGRLVTESGKSSINNYEAGSEELTTLFSVLCATPGIYGSRFSGAGFKGCCIAIVDPKFKESIKSSVLKKYGEAYPNLADKAAVYFCKTADGCSDL